MKIVKTTTIRAVVTKMSAASTTSLVAQIWNRVILILARHDCRWQESVEEGDIGLPVDHLDEGESNTSTKPPVGHDELLLQVDLLQAEPGGNFYLLEHFEGHVDPLLVGNECEDVDTDEADEEAEDDRP